jgi:glycosyltransferase involved in cell wall biosynthesis
MLPFDITLIEGMGADAQSNSQTLRSRWSNARTRSSFRTTLNRFLPWVPGPESDDTAIVAGFLEEQQFDVVLAEYGTTAAGITSACERAGIPLVTHFHGFDASRRSILESYEKAYMEMFAYASRIVAVSHDMRQRLLKLGCPPEKLIISPCGPDNAFLHLPTALNSNQVVAVGRLVEKKSPNLLILAFHKVLARHPDLCLTIVGDGPLRLTCEELIETLGLEDNIRLVGAATSEEIRRYMSDSFLFAQHSIVASDGDSEGTPVAIMEASAAGLPVVATRHGGITDVIVEGQTGLLVDEHDVDGMSDSIGVLASNRTLAREMGLRGRARIAASFTLERHIADLAAVLRDAAAG